MRESLPKHNPLQKSNELATDKFLAKHKNSITKWDFVRELSLGNFIAKLSLAKFSEKGGIPH